MVRVTLPTGRQEWPNGHGQLLGLLGLVKKSVGGWRSAPAYAKASAGRSLEG